MTYERSVNGVSSANETNIKLVLSILFYKISEIKAIENSLKFMQNKTYQN